MIFFFVTVGLHPPFSIIQSKTKLAGIDGKAAYAISGVFIYRDFLIYGGA